MYNWVVEILPYIDQPDLANSWARTGPVSGGGVVPLSYLATTSHAAGPAQQLRHRSTTSLAVLRCPDDNSAQPGQGNLSYVVNGGFSLWTALPLGWTASAVDGAADGQLLRLFRDALGLAVAGLGGDVNVCKKLGVMFLEDYGALRAIAHARCHGTCGRLIPPSPTARPIPCC